jgi:Pyridine nucleotide-disulphide oxidoreductase
MSSSSPVTIIGAGPYALSTAAFLRRARIDVRVFGDVMGFWHSMPAGMFLRSYRTASSIADPEGALTLDAFEAASGCKLSTPTALDEFIEYGHWFQRQAEVEVDPRRVSRLSRNSDGFRLALDDGELLEAKRVVVAAGITDFAWKPPLFDGVEPELASHSSKHSEFSAFAGKNVLVVGGGQSALESAALLSESGASSVELVARQGMLHFLRGERLYESAGFLSRLLYPSWGVGPPGLNWIMGRPALFRRLPPSVAGPLAHRATRPAGAGWLRPRLEGIRISIGRSIRSVQKADSKVRLRLDDDSEREVDHVLIGTGYRVDLSRYSFFDPDLLRPLRLIGSFPRLTSSFESSVPGLYFVGAPAAASAGPGMRFVSHTGFAAAAITQSALKRS